MFWDSVFWITCQDHSVKVLSSCFFQLRISPKAMTRQGKALVSFDSFFFNSTFSGSARPVSCTFKIHTYPSRSPHLHHPIPVRSFTISHLGSQSPLTPLPAFTLAPEKLGDLWRIKSNYVTSCLKSSSSFPYTQNKTQTHDQGMQELATWSDPANLPRLIPGRFPHWASLPPTSLLFIPWTQQTNLLSSELCTGASLIGRLFLGLCAFLLFRLLFWTAVPRGPI